MGLSTHSHAHQMAWEAWEGQLWDLECESCACGIVVLQCLWCNVWAVRWLLCLNWERVFCIHPLKGNLKMALGCHYKFNFKIHQSWCLKVILRGPPVHWISLSEVLWLWCLVPERYVAQLVVTKYVGPSSYLSWTPTSAWSKQLCLSGHSLHGCQPQQVANAAAAEIEDPLMGSKKRCGHGVESSWKGLAMRVHCKRGLKIWVDRAGSCQSKGWVVQGNI